MERRLIDANAVALDIRRAKGFDTFGDKRFAYDIVNGADTIDAVEVVRCKDCKYWASNGKDEILGVEDGVCCCDQWENDFLNVETTSDDFCSYGERRKEDAAD